MRQVAMLMIAGVLFPGAAMAQLVTPSEGGQVCANKPDEPVIIQNMDTRESHRVRLLQRMYTATAFADIVEAGECTCERRFPSWEPVVDYYLQNYAKLEDRHDIYAAREPYDDVVNQTRTDARTICVEAGNWN